MSSRAQQQNRLALVETLGSVLWFIMDGFWMLSQTLPAKGMVAPTLAVNLLVFRYTERSFSQYCVVAAMNSWLLMNICWMLGDLDKDPRPVAVAQMMFALGMLLLLLAVAKNVRHPERLVKGLTRFRRLRM